MLRLIQRDLGRMHELTPEQQEPLSKLPPEIHAKLNALPPKPQSHPAIKPLLLRLVGVGLVTEVRMRPEEEGSELSCHELVRERIQTWMEQHAQDRGELTQSTIRLGYAERLLEIFESLQNEDMGITLQAGSRALVYCVQAEAWDHMDGFVGQLVTTIQNPRLLEELIPHLRSAANLAPEGAPRYRCLLFLADALDMARHHYDSFPLYEQAAIQAHVAASTDSENSKSAWKYLAIISQNWADALTNVSEFDAAYQRYSEAIDAYKTVGDAAIEIISCELDILRIAIKQGKADTALSDVEERLAQFEDWWQLHRTGQLPEAIRINTSLLARKLIRALEISGEAHLSQENWDAVVQRLDSILEMHSNLGSSGDHGAFYRMSRANVLVRLNRFSEAQVELEDCFRIFHENPTGQAKVLNALADLFDEQDDVTQAITQSRRALAICENLPSPSDRALSHNNLANYLQRAEISATGDEANRHRLAALIYLLVAELGQQLKTTLKCYVKSFHNAFASGVELTVPRVNELLDDSAFDSLQQWLLQRLVDIDELQTKVDSYLDLIRQAVIEQG
jgi:tetratricopeptide (TPR) repeat protein